MVKQKGKRRSSKRQNRQLRKRHREDAQHLASFREEEIRQKILPQWEEAIEKDQKRLESLPRKERRFAAVKRQLGLEEDVTASLPVPPVISEKQISVSNHTKLHNQKAQELDRMGTPKTHQKQSQQQQKPQIYDLWDKEPKKKKSKPRKSKTSSASSLLNSIVPHPGQSYNPDVKQYQHALSTAAKSELYKIVKEKRVEKRLNPDSSDPNVLSGGLDALDGLNIQQRADTKEAATSKEILQERERLRQEIKRLRERESQPKPLLRNAQIARRKLHKIQLAKKRRRIQQRFKKKTTLPDDITKAEEEVSRMEREKERRRENRRRKNVQQRQRSFASVKDAKDIYLPEEMPSRLSNTAQNSVGLLSAQLRQIHDSKVGI